MINGLHATLTGLDLFLIGFRALRFRSHPAITFVAFSDFRNFLDRIMARKGRVGWFDIRKARGVSLPRAKSWGTRVKGYLHFE